MTEQLDFLSSARRTLETEGNAILALGDYLTDSFSQACKRLLQCRGRVIVLGIGKSGHVGKKMAATFASTGTPSFFVHPAEASHGDMGMITSQDIVIALSNSGETSEVLSLIPLIKRLRAPLISMTGNANSSLAKASEVHISLPEMPEACPLGLAPTTSTTMTLAMGDALAIALLEARGFTAEDFAFSHPGGSLGRRLLLRARDLMHKDAELPRVSPSTLLRDALMEITRKGLGLTTVTDDDGKLLGIFTDGDLRRALDQQLDLHSLTIDRVMTRRCKTIEGDILAAEALNIMEEVSITALVVVDEERPVGILHMHDLIKAGVV
ncbi:KpsF/GutQ family sugar-phosphate isomerase [Pokkaliibacter sp. CJK22405]|uniref:KpsF/GutQ family sugar-phosphate isomerase n=1 Tax=Pokkaliibacter sp. CJK22405 TaxID=3384615 RepID=UPI0039848144